MAKITDLERCPKCGRFQVYAGHDTRDDTWDIHCDCGLSTGSFRTYKVARRNWDKIVKKFNGGRV